MYYGKFCKSKNYRIYVRVADTRHFSQLAGSEAPFGMEFRQLFTNW